MFDERALQAVWYGGQAPSLWLRMVAGVFGIVSRLRRRLYALGLLPRARMPVPVIVIGNISVGGTGKTPLTIALVEALRERGFKPGVISRGYGGNARVATRVDAQSDPAMVGDEARLIFDATQAPVAVDRDRTAAALSLLANGNVDVIVADDGLQHYRLQRDVEICVIDGERRFGNGRLLPAGPLREPTARLASVDFRVCNGGVAQEDEVPISLVGDTVVALSGAQEKTLRDFAGQRVHAVAGIGNPTRFFAKLRAAGIDVIEYAFPDHHAYAASDLDFGDELPVLMTEKDAVKCAAFARPNWWKVPVRAQLLPHFFDAVAQLLRASDKTR
ncbi:MAG: tetraacyldisaccharide 4'-kinase [Xanthomonadales bacterium PRO7]|nr:tetraacyldisaccharide 4'-kinase [Xanthomonadales bacterium PRO7]